MSDSSLKRTTDQADAADDHLSVADKDMRDGLEEAARKEVMAVRAKRDQLVSDSGRFGLTDFSADEPESVATAEESEAAHYNEAERALLNPSDECGGDRTYTPANFADLGSWQAKQYHKMGVEVVRVSNGRVHFKLSDSYEQSLGVFEPTITLDRSFSYGLYGKQDDIALDPVYGIKCDGKPVDKIEIKYDKITIWCGGKAIVVNGRKEADAMQGMFTPGGLRDAVRDSAT